MPLRQLNLTASAAAPPSCRGTVQQVSTCPTALFCRAQPVLKTLSSPLSAPNRTCSVSETRSANSGRSDGSVAKRCDGIQGRCSRFRWTDRSTRASIWCQHSCNASATQKRQVAIGLRVPDCTDVRPFPSLRWNVKCNTQLHQAMSLLARQSRCLLSDSLLDGALVTDAPDQESRHRSKQSKMTDECR